MGISTSIWPNILMVRRVQGIGPMKSRTEGDHVVVNFISTFVPTKFFNMVRNCPLNNTNIVLHHLDHFYNCFSNPMP